MRGADLTTFKLGGEITDYFLVKTPEALMVAVSQVAKSKIPYYLIAGGSNVVLNDGQINGRLIHFSNPRGYLAVKRQTVVVDANVSLSRLIKRAINAGLGGLEALSGIPGTVGGAIVGNAGAYGQNISDHLLEVEIWDGKKTRWLSKKNAKFAYRDSIFKHRPWLVLRAKFGLEPRDKRALGKKSRAIIKIRQAKYAPGLLCPGSFFKNVLPEKITKTAARLLPPDAVVYGRIPAGYLLERVGAKGMREGGIYVADYHGNLLINDGTGTSAQVRRLADKLKKKVFKKFKIKLEEEVRYML